MKYDDERWNDYQGYDPGGLNPEQLMNRLLENQKRISATLQEIKEVDGKVEFNRSQITQTAEQIEQKVSKVDFNGETLVSLINQTAETVKIMAKFIELTLSHGEGAFRILDQNQELITELSAEARGFSELFIGTLRANDVSSPNVVNYRGSNQTLNVSRTGNDNNTGTSSSPLRTISEALSRVAKITDGTVTILLHSHLSEDVRIAGLSGEGVIRLDFNGFNLTGTVFITSNAKDVLVYSSSGSKSVITRKGGDFVISSRGNKFVQIQDLELNGDGQFSAVQMDQGDTLYANRVETYNVARGFYANRGSTAIIRSCSGLASLSGVRADNGSDVRTIESIPHGESQAVQLNSASSHTGTLNTDLGKASPPPVAPTPIEVTEVFTQTATGNFRQNFNGQWNANNSRPYQGKWDTWGSYWGLWFFGETIRNKVNGKSIESIRIRPQRRSEGGNSGDVSVVFRTHNHASTPSGQPTVSSHTHTVSFKWGERKWVTLPSTFRDAFANGSARGIAIYTTNTSNSHYAIFSEDIEVEITYTP